MINRLLVLFNTPLSSGSFGFHYLPPFPRPYTTTYPLHLLTYHVGRSGFGTYLVAFGCTYGLGTVSSTPSACRSLSLPFRFDTRTGLRPGCCTSSVISTNDVAYLPGLHTARPSAFVEGGGFEPPTYLALSASRFQPHAFGAFPLGQPSQYVYPDFSLLIKPANFTAGWVAFNI